MSTPSSETVGASVPEKIRTLVSQHARAWRKAGQSNNGAIFDPYGGMWMKSARDAEKALLKAIAELITDEDVSK